MSVIVQPSSLIDDNILRIRLRFFSRGAKELPSSAHVMSAFLQKALQSIVIHCPVNHASKYRYIKRLLRVMNQALERMMSLVKSVGSN
jgi:hypothetical protein